MTTLTCSYTPTHGDPPLTVSFSWHLHGKPLTEYTMRGNYLNGDAYNWSLFTDEHGDGKWGVPHTFTDSTHYAVTYTATNKNDPSDTITRNVIVNTQASPKTTYTYKTWLDTTPDIDSTLGGFEIPCEVSITPKGKLIGSDNPPTIVPLTFVGTKWFGRDSQGNSYYTSSGNTYVLKDNWDVGTRTIKCSSSTKDTPEKKGWDVSYPWVNFKFVSSLDQHNLADFSPNGYKVNEEINVRENTTCNKPFTSKIDWGDGTVETVVNGVLKHKYTSAGTYLITLTSTVDHTSHTLKKTYSMNIAPRTLSLVISSPDLVNNTVIANTPFFLAADLSPAGITVLHYKWFLENIKLPTSGNILSLSGACVGHHRFTCTAYTKTDGNVTAVFDLIAKKRPLAVEVTKTSGENGTLPRTFIYSIKEKNGNSLQKISIDWGDHTSLATNTSSSKEVVQHSYNTPGNFTITFTVGNSNNVVITKHVIVLKPELQCILEATPVSGYIPKTVNFAVKILKGKPESYEWVFGDGSTKTTTIRMTEHTYTTEGAYIPRCTVIDHWGTQVLVQTKVAYLKLPPPPNPSFFITTSGDKNILRAQDTLTFNNTTVGPVTSYKWTINGTLYTTKNVKIVFDSAGEYKIILTAKNPGGEGTCEKTITVRGNVHTRMLHGDEGIIPGNFIEEVSLPRKTFDYDLPTRNEILAGLAGFAAHSFTIFDNPSRFYEKSIYHIAEGIPLHQENPPFYLKQLDLNTSGVYWCIDSSPVSTTSNERVLYHIVDTLAITYKVEMDFRLLPQASYYETTKFSLICNPGDGRLYILRNISRRYGMCIGPIT